MRSILINLTWLKSNSQIKGGVIQYSERLTSALVRYTDLKIYVLSPRNCILNFDHLRSCKNFFPHELLSYDDITKFVDNMQIDIIHTPIQYHNILCTESPMVNTLHDLQHIHFPQFFIEKEIQFREKYYQSSCIFSDRIIVGYEHVKNDLVKYYAIDPDKIDICPVGFDRPRRPDETSSEKIKQTFQLNQPYIFYAASTWEHKNHLNLIRALQLVHKNFEQKISLICAGHPIEPNFTNLQRECSSLGIQDYVKFTGYIPEKEMLSILDNAALVVIPTFYEAGSYPLLEAMSFKIPVICSNVTSLPATIEKEEFTFNPRNIHEIAHKIKDMLTDKKLRDENIRNSENIIETMRWEIKIDHFIEAYEKAIKQFEKHFKNPVLRDKISSYESLIHDYYSKKLITLEHNQKRTSKKIGMLETQIVNLYNSYSWRFAKPFRIFSRLPKNIKTKITHLISGHDHNG